MKLRHVLRALQHYAVFFLLMAFVITCCMVLFVETMTDNMNIVLSEADVNAAAKRTFVNVVALSLICTVIDALRRRIMVGRPVKKITDAAQRIMQGDFSVRIPPVSRFGSDDPFNRIIECFNRMAEELSGTETLRTDFIANVSHELKTPLAVMHNYGAMLKRPGLTEAERMEYAQAITNASRRLANLIENILKLNKLENQQIFPAWAAFDLSEQLCQCLLQFEDAWESKRIEIETDIADGVIVQSDAELLSLVWNNLFSNAVKFTEPGGRIGVRLRCDGDWIIVQVEDTGCGMSADVGAHIFEKFYQGDTSHATQGNGLGLALVRRVVDIVRGEIHVQSRLGEGSTFTVKIRGLKYAENTKPVG